MSSIDKTIFDGWSIMFTHKQYSVSPQGRNYLVPQGQMPKLKNFHLCVF